MGKFKKNKIYKSILNNMLVICLAENEEDNTRFKGLVITNSDSIENKYGFYKKLCKELFVDYDGKLKQ